MSKRKTVLVILMSFLSITFYHCDMHEKMDEIDLINEDINSPSLLKGGSSSVETFGNNLSYPVIWAEGVSKMLRGTPEMEPILNGEWWYWWGTEGVDPDIVPLSCIPDPDDPNFCDDGIPGQVTGNLPGDGWVKAYIQKDEFNVWQAGNIDGSVTPVVVDFIDWGDNLESVDWYTKSRVRTEVVLFKTLDPVMLEYEMRHVSGWGIDEVHGLAVAQDGNPIIGSGVQGTVYSNCARLTIQKLLVDKNHPDLINLVWNPNLGWKENELYEGELINAPIFNNPVYEGEDGPGYYSAEINVKGRVIYGYTWDVKRLNDKIVNGGEAAGYYRITFSFDNTDGVNLLNTYFVENQTQILLPLEEEVVIESSEETDGGASAVIDYVNNLTYIDVKILEKSGGSN